MGENNGIKIESLILNNKTALVTINIIIFLGRREGERDKYIFIGLSLYSQVNAREGGDIQLFITLVPKVS